MPNGRLICRVSGAGALRGISEDALPEEALDCGACFGCGQHHDGVADPHHVFPLGYPDPSGSRAEGFTAHAGRARAEMLLEPKMATFLML